MVDGFGAFAKLLFLIPNPSTKLGQLQVPTTRLVEQTTVENVRVGIVAAGVSFDSARAVTVNIIVIASSAIEEMVRLYIVRTRLSSPLFGRDFAPIVTRTQRRSSD